jgi:hypothetical protein
MEDNTDAVAAAANTASAQATPYVISLSLSLSLSDLTRVASSAIWSNAIDFSCLDATSFSNLLVCMISVLAISIVMTYQLFIPN